MSKAICLHLLFICGILCQGIFATLSDKNTRLSLVRERRVVNYLPRARTITRIESVNYIVKIREVNRTTCAGSILSHYNVITAALCIRQHFSGYDVASGTATYRGFTLHNVTSIERHSGNPPYQHLDGIALLTVDPPFEFNAKTGSISLYEGPNLATGTMVNVYGWGYIYPLLPRVDTRHKLNTITLPIMSHQACKNALTHRLSITDKHICTYHDQQHCAQSDEGAPLVYNNKLVGIHILKEAYPDRINPDIFINLQHPEYREWIIANTLLM